MMLVFIIILQDHLYVHGVVYNCTEVVLYDLYGGSDTMYISGRKTFLMNTYHLSELEFFICFV